ncbi:MAG: aspartate/glutamate racemase family protein [Clostridia bacterium]|nr:aspartate/glutamate racemase family protein [Clostridia bacterium]
MANNAKIGLLRWEKGHVPVGLMQLEALKGNSTNAESYPFPVDMRHVEGACTETIINHPSQEVCDRFIEIGREMQAEGIKALTGSCGFNAIFQKQVSEALDIPVFLSSLLQVPFALQIIAPSKKVAVMTAYGSSLTPEHFGYCGVNDMSRIIVLGLENCPEWNSIFEKEDEPVNMDLVEKEIMGTALDAVKEHPEIGAFVLECTDLPPFGPAIRDATGLPVFSFSTMAGYMALMLGELNLY